MQFVLKSEIIELMKERHATYGQTQFTTGEMFDLVMEKFPNFVTNASRIAASVAAMKKDGIVVDLGFVEGNRKAKYFGLSEILDEVTAPTETNEPEPIAIQSSDDGGFIEAPRPLSTEGAGAILRNLDRTQRAEAFTTTVKEISTMANDNATNNRKPREGTPEHDIMRLTKLADRQAEQNAQQTEQNTRQSEQINSLLAIVARMEKSSDGVGLALEKFLSTGNGLGEAQLAAMNRLKEDVLSVMGIVAGEIAITRMDAQQMEGNICNLLDTINKADEIEKSAYASGFADGWSNSRSKLAAEILAASSKQEATSPVLKDLEVSTKKEKDILAMVQNLMQRSDTDS